MSLDLLKLYFVQMTSGTSLSSNLDCVRQHFKLAREQGAQFIVLPEMFALFGVDDQRSLAAQESEFTGPIGSEIRTLAADTGLWVIAGTIPVLIPEDTRPRARCHVLNDQGALVTFYDKIHLFDAKVGDTHGRYKESDNYSPGIFPVTFESPWGIIGLAVCYDLRFAELFLKLNQKGARLIVVPSAFTHKTGQAHWEVLCRARAIENGLFIAAVNQCGQHDQTRSTWGHSMLVDPWGTLQSMGEQPAGHCFSVDFLLVESVRETLPVNEHRRL